MPQLTNLNTFPYFDDFDKDENYYKVLFKPGQPVQARELTTLQSILQNQIEKFGTNIFKEGSVVIPGTLAVRSNQYFIALEDTFAGVDVTQYISNLLEVEIRGSQSGVRAKVSIVVEDEAVLFLDVSNSGFDIDSSDFFVGESLIVDETVNLTDSDISIFTEGSEIGVVESIGFGCIAKITEGVFFLRGYFVDVPEQTIVVSLDEAEPTCSVGFAVAEQLIDSYDDDSLFDNSQGFVNFAAPGADRLKISADLTSTYLEGGSEDTPQNFVELVKIKSGNIISSKVENPQLNILGDELARRTFDESGHYYIKPFSLNVRDSARDYKGNNGVYNFDEVNAFGETPRDDFGVYDISDGKAYVFGYEVNMLSNTLLDFRKPRELKEITGEAVSYVTGPTVSLTRAFGAPNLGLSTSYTISLRNERVGSAQTIAAGKEIGLARIYDYALESGSYETTNLDANIWDLSLFDIVPFTDLIVNENIESLQTPTFIEGQASGAVGFLRYDVTNSGIITAYNVRGNFIKGEKLIFDGNDSDRVTTASTTYSISNAKSVFAESGISTFSADIRQKPVLSLGPCKIDGSGVVTQAGRDFTKDFAINDLVQYITPGGSNPTINRVSAVTSDNITLAAVENVTGVSIGSVSSAIDSIDIVKISTNLLTSDVEDGNFLFTQLPKEFIASIDTTDSEISYRKRFDTEIVSDVSGGRVTIFPSDLEDNETFLPFDEERYILINENGQTEILTSDKFTITSGSRELIIRGLSTIGTAVLIATLKKPEASPIIKNRVRLEKVIVNKSSLEGSGIGVTSLNDGLFYGNYPYGTRVQDKEICLLRPDVTNLFAIYESSTNGFARIPQLNLSSVESFNGSAEDALLGEEIFGSSSGCLAVLADVLDSNRIEYIPINGKEFEIGEQITFQDTSVFGIIGGIIQGDNNITDKYTLLNGYKNTIYDYSKIVRNSDEISPTKSITIFYEYADIETSDTGSLITVDSYINFDYKDIGNTNGIRHSDIIDIRPRVSTYIIGEGERSPFEFLGRNFEDKRNKNLKVLASDESITIDYSIYLPRIDKIYLNKDKFFQLSIGVPSENPTDPFPIEDAIEVARISLPPYLFDPSDAKLSLSSYKRYQMRDIADLEDRIESLEFYTTLSLLEQSTSNLEIKDSEGTDRFKSGFFVDNFTTTTNQLQFGPKNSIDPDNNELRPSSYTTELDLLLGSSELTGVGGELNPDADPRYVTDLIADNIRRSTVDPNGSPGSDGMGVLTLDYEEVEFISQDNATRVVNAAPYLVTFYKGTITLNPSSDIWVDQSRVETQTVEGLLGGYTVKNVKARGRDLDPQAGWSPILWGSWNKEWTGSKSRKSKVSDRDTATKRGVKASVKTTITSTTTKRTGTQSRTGLSTRVKTVPGNRINLGDKIVNSNVSSFLRSRNIEVISKRLKPNTEFYTFFGGINVTQYCIPKLIEIRMVRGAFEPGELIRSRGRRPGITQDKPFIRFRAALPRHKYGPYNDPIDGYFENPYTGVELADDYSTSSTILNVDLTSLCLKAEGKYYGYISPGMVLVGKRSKARAIVTDVRLVSDETGTLLSSFYIPNSNARTAPKFKTGNNTLKIQDSPTLSGIDGTLSSAGESVYFSQGTIQQVQKTIISTRNVQAVNAYTLDSESITDETTTITSVDVSLKVNVTPQPIPKPQPRPRRPPRRPPVRPPVRPPRRPPVRPPVGRKPRPRPAVRPPTPRPFVAPPRPAPRAARPVPRPRPRPRPKAVVPRPVPRARRPRPTPKVARPVPKPVRSRDDTRRPKPKRRVTRPIPVPNPRPVPKPVKPKVFPKAVRPRPQPKPRPVPRPVRPPKARPKKPPKRLPTPRPRPRPLPKPKPRPQPKPQPRPQPRPIPLPFPSPQPVPAPVPAPSPNPQPQPAPTPRPNPKPKPAPKPKPNPKPQPRPSDDTINPNKPKPKRQQKDDSIKPTPKPKAKAKTKKKVKKVKVAKKGSGSNKRPIANRLRTKKDDSSGRNVVVKKTPKQKGKDNKEKNNRKGKSDDSNSGSGVRNTQKGGKKKKGGNKGNKKKNCKYDDPLAQSFFVGNDEDKTGIFVTSASLYFQTASEFESCFVQLRPMINGLPSADDVYPMSNVVVQGADIETSEDASIPTVVTFPAPIYLEGNKEHCLVIGSRSTAFNLFVSRLGEVDVSSLENPESEQIPITQQSTLGSLFKSQNSRTWTPSQYEDLKYSLNRAEFADNGFISFFNPDLSRGNDQVANLKQDSLQGSSRSIIVGLGTITAGFGTEIVPGNTVKQDNSTGTGNYVMGLGIATDTMSIINPGLGLTPSSGFFQYDYVPLTKVTGMGQNATANIHVNNGVAVAATIAEGGGGYKVGDVLTASLGSGVGRNLQLSIPQIYGISELLLDQVQGEFEVGVGKTLRYENSAGLTSEFSNNASITLDSNIRVINDGLNIKVRHLNHGMHSPTNRVSISEVESDVPFTVLTFDTPASGIDEIELDNTEEFGNFEGIGIGTTNPGYVLIGSEIVGYTSITDNTISGLTREVDFTLSDNYDAGEMVMKYEANGVSLRRINKIHELQDSTVKEPIGLDHYNIVIDMSDEFGTDRSDSSSFPNLYLKETKSFGGNNILATQNISYEIMKPIISAMAVQKTNVSARARTVSSTSISGNEVSFVDQGYEDIAIDDDNYFETPRLIASDINADSLLEDLPGQKSFEIALTLDTFDSRLSPVIDLDRVGAIFVSNRVNEVITDYVNDSRTSSIENDPSAFIYATKPIELEIPANNLRVITAAYINNFSDIRAFYAITNDPEEELIYYPFPGYDNLLESGQIIDFNKNNGRPDALVSPVDSKGFESVSLTFKDYEFTIENLPSFKFFSIKMVATSTNQCYPPRLRDFRAIAFA